MPKSFGMMAKSVENAMLSAEDNPAEAGLAQLREEYTSSGKSNSLIDKTVQRLENDGAMNAIVDAWAGSLLKPGDTMDRDLAVYFKNSCEVSHRIKTDNHLDRLLRDRFLERFDKVADGRKYCGRWGLVPTATVSDEALDLKIAADNKNVGRQRIREDLNAFGPKGQLHLILSKLAESGKITEQTLEEANEKQDQLELSPVQKTALKDLMTRWDHDDGVKPFRVDVNTEFSPLYPGDKINPFYGLDPFNRAKPWNYSSTTKPVDYLGPAAVEKLLSRKFNDSP